MSEYSGHIVEFRTKRAADRHAAMSNARMGCVAAYVVKIDGTYQVRFNKGL